MRVLFVCSGNSSAGIGTVVFNQAEALRKQGVEIDFFTIEGKKAGGYLRNVPSLLKHLKKNRYEIIHAHYSLSGFVASFSWGVPLVVSLMGSDAFMSSFWRFVVSTFYRFRWKITIVKTEEMKRSLGMDKALVIPNGVDMELFKTITRSEAREHIHFTGVKKLVVFVADPSRHEKNFDLARSSVQYLKRNDIELIPVFNVKHSEIPYYLYAADVLILTSVWEGSVNVVKEAMACGLPIVSTDVGDVRENLGNVTGCYICESNPESLAKGVDSALMINGRTNGREILISLKLNSDSVAKRITEVYNDVAGRK